MGFLEEIEIKQDYERRKRLNVMAPGLALIVVFVLGAMVRGTARLVLISVGLSAIAGFHYWNWRCPSCKGYLQGNLNPSFCPSCGIALQ